MGRFGSGSVLRFYKNRFAPMSYHVSVLSLGAGPGSLGGRRGKSITAKGVREEEDNTCTCTV